MSSTQRTTRGARVGARCARAREWQRWLVLPLPEDDTAPVIVVTTIVARCFVVLTVGGAGTRGGRGACGRIILSSPALTVPLPV
jgi:hypothetical protein